MDKTTKIGYNDLILSHLNKITGGVLLSLKEVYDLYLHNEEADVEPIAFDDFCRWYCVMTGTSHHQLFEDEQFKQFLQDVS